MSEAEKKTEDLNVTFVGIPMSEWKELKAQISQLEKGVQSIKANVRDENLTITQVCKELKISRSSFYSYRRKGFLKVTQIGKKQLVKRTDLEDAITKGII